MLTGPAGGVRIFVGLDPVDMRGSFKSMAGAARRLGLEPLDGHYYLFVPVRRCTSGPLSSRMRPSSDGTSTTSSAIILDQAG